MAFFRTFLSSIADAGRELLEGRLGYGDKTPDMGDLCSDLIAHKGEALGTVLACAVVDTYEGYDETQKHNFFEMLLKDFDVDQSALNVAIQAYQKSPNPMLAQRVGVCAEAFRQRLVRGINMAPGGTRAVINMREDLLARLRDHPALRPVDADFMHLLSSWFNRGFLKLRRIDWNTPANILEKLITYEAVHEIRDWDDLRRRLDSDRRCYAFFHPALPDEPLIFVEVALVQGLASSVQDLLEDTQPRISSRSADTAIFYSISNCQKGLRGISFGNFLIKQVVAELRAELPNLEVFSTLSPVPGFSRWLQNLRDGEENDIPELDGLDLQNGVKNSDQVENLKRPIMQLCAHYLVNAKKSGQPIDGVERFHLGNGAHLERINWLGDTSQKGLRESMGLLVNYKYDLNNIETNHEAFTNDGIIKHSKTIEKLLADTPKVLMDEQA